MYNHLDNDVPGRQLAPYVPHVYECRTYSALSDYFSLPGVKKPLGQYGPVGVEDTTSGSAPVKEEEEDDDDIDLFGSDEEEVSLMAFKLIYWLRDELFSHHLSADVVMDLFIPDYQSLSKWSV